MTKKQKIDKNIKQFSNSYINIEKRKDRSKHSLHFNSLLHFSKSHNFN